MMSAPHDGTAGPPPVSVTLARAAAARENPDVMRVMTARVVDGKIDVGEAEIQEGAAVAVLIPDADGFSLSEEDQEELELALGDVQRGEFTDGRELLRELKGLGSR